MRHLFSPVCPSSAPLPDGAFFNPGTGARPLHQGISPVQSPQYTGGPPTDSVGRNSTASRRTPAAVGNAPRGPAPGPPWGALSISGRVSRIRDAACRGRFLRFLPPAPSVPSFGWWTCVSDFGVRSLAPWLLKSPHGSPGACWKALRTMGWWRVRHFLAWRYWRPPSLNIRLSGPAGRGVPYRPHPVALASVKYVTINPPLFPVYLSVQ